MLDITPGPQGELIFTGRLDASQAERAKAALAGLQGTGTLDFKALDYISSAGLGILLAAQKTPGGKGLRLVNLSAPVRDVFHFSGFDQIFEIL